MTHYKDKESKGFYGRLSGFIPYILAAVLWIILTTCSHFFLRKVEDMSVFLFEWQFILDSFSVPGGILGAAGSFFTQFLYYPWLGSFIWILFLTLSYQLTVKAFRLERGFRSLALIPVALLVIGNMSLGYGVFIMRFQDHFFAPVLGYMLALIPVFAITRIRPVWGKLLMLTLWTAIGFPLLGIFAHAGTLAAACATLTDSKVPTGNRITVLISAIALIIVVPLLSYSLYTSYRLADSWSLGLPDISEESWATAVRTPFILAILFLPVLAAVSNLLSSKSWSLIPETAVYIISVAAVWGFWYNDENFNTELAMSDAVDSFEWQKVVDIYKEAVSSHASSDAKAYASRTAKLKGISDPQKVNDIVDSYSDKFFEPTRTMVIYRDLALLKMNKALDEAFILKDGGHPQKSRSQIPMAYMAGCQLYFQYGLSNLCYRWILECAVEYGWNASSLKYMALMAILTDEHNLADKFLGKLDKTLFHRSWSQKFRQLASTDQSAGVSPFNTIKPLLCFEDKMTNDLGKCELYLLRHFVQDRPENATPEFDRISLFWAMRSQSIPDFWARLSDYLDTNPTSKLPHAVQEAAILYSSLENLKLNFNLDKSVTDSYDRFTQYVSKHQIRNMKESAYPFSQQFGKTFFYYYYFIRNLQTY